MVKEVADFNSLRINSFLTVIKGTSNENEILYSQTRSKINIYLAQTECQKQITSFISKLIFLPKVWFENRIRK